MGIGFVSFHPYPKDLYGMSIVNGGSTNLYRNMSEEVRPIYAAWIKIKTFRARISTNPIPKGRRDLGRVFPGFPDWEGRALMNASVA
jgi:hypothetical protein